MQPITFDLSPSASGDDAYQRIGEVMQKSYDQWLRDSSCDRTRYQHAEYRFEGYLAKETLDAAKRLQDEGVSDGVQRRLRSAESRHAEQMPVIELPYSSAVMLTQFTYMWGVLFQRTPFYQIVSWSPDRADKEQKIEALLHHQITRARTQREIASWLMTVCKKGNAALRNDWVTRKQLVSSLAAVDPTDPLFRGHRVAMTTQELPGYTGNEGLAIQPEHFIYDTRQPFAKGAEGSFCGELTRLRRGEIVAGVSSGKYMRSVLKLLDRAKGKRFSVTQEGYDVADTIHSARVADSDMQLEAFKSGDLFEALELTLRCTPEELGISTQAFPGQQQLFRVGMLAGKVLLYVRPAGTLYPDAPYHTLTSDVDFTRRASLSVLDRMAPLEALMNWLIQSHQYSVRQALGNNFLWDPSRVMIDDVERRPPGGGIRLRPSAFGTDVNQALKQMQQWDVTGGHLQSLAFIDSFGERLTGTNARLMGQIQVGGRRSATEITADSTFSSNRMRVQTEWLSMTGIYTLGTHMLMNCQQWLPSDTQVRLLNTDPAGRPIFEQLDAASITGQFEFRPIDGTSPVERSQIGSLMQQMFMSVASSEALSQRYDLGAMFEFVAELFGLPAMSKFRLQVLPPGQEPSGPPATPTGEPQSA